ncbi:hypothetical protein GQ54DRAFT_264209 [Martensiomyces pterosporus]|nr:hypothetical protein GQ54DRAFT_264209 [Martensiomyces pterosporus]
MGGRSANAFHNDSLTRYQHVADDGSYRNPWDDGSSAKSDAYASAVVDQPLQLSPRRAARRVRAAHDPLLSPSAADADFFEHSLAKQAQESLLESICEAISSPLPRSETHMVHVKADSDFHTPDCAGLLPAQESNLVSRPDTNCSSLVIGAADGCGKRHPSAPSTSLPARLGEDILRMYTGTGLSASEGSNSQSPSLILQQQQQPPRTIKMIQHHIRASDTLEGISIQYGTSISHLKRLNRLWQPNEISTREFLYIPLRMCSEKYSLAYIDYVNTRYKEERNSGMKPAVMPITIIEVLLDPAGRQPPAAPAYGCPTNHRRNPSWAIVPYESIQRDFSFTM